MLHRLEELRLQVAASNDPESSFEDIERLTLVEMDGLYHVEFYGSCYDWAYASFCEVISKPEVAETLASISLRGPDEGANGTRNWDLAPLADHKQPFPRLQTFSVELNKLGDHNQSIIASSYDEGGVIARFVQKCPRLTHLKVPSAPSSEFFEVSLPCLQYLSVDAGYSTQNFVRHFSQRKGFPSLRTFEWGEYSERYMDQWQTFCTSFTEYEGLFASSAFRTVKRFVLRQPIVTTDQIQALRVMRTDIQFLLVCCTSEYVRKL